MNDTDKIRELEKLVTELKASNDWYRGAYESLKREPEETAEERAARKQREANERMQAQLAAARARAIREIVKLLPQAVKQARAGKPALLRMILRATR